MVEILQVLKKDFQVFASRITLIIIEARKRFEKFFLFIQITSPNIEFVSFTYIFIVTRVIKQ